MIQARDDDGPDQTKNPGADGVHRNVGVICVGDGRPDFWVRGVVLWKRDNRRKSKTRRLSYSPRTPAIASSLSMLGSSNSGRATASSSSSVVDDVHEPLSSTGPRTGRTEIDLLLGFR